MRPNWCGCDGHGNEVSGRPRKRPIRTVAAAPDCGARFTRRQALMGAALASVSWMTRSATALADVAVTPGQQEMRGDVLVVVFMRGGADGLNMVVPYGEDAYHRHRQTIGVAAPNDRRAGATNRALDLDGFFGLHPALAPLRPLYSNGLLGFAHAVGSGDDTRSHFEAMSAMERGLATESVGTGSGWLARHLDNSPRDNASPLRAVAFSNVMPDSLRGATDATALNSLADFRLSLPTTIDAKQPSGNKENRTEAMHHTLSQLYEGGQDAVAHAGRETLAVLETLNKLDPTHYRPANGAVYPNSELGTGLRQVACLLKGHVGLEIACLDHRGPYLWDTHVAQNNILPAQLEDIGKSLAAFAGDMGKEMKGVTVVGMTEFGRRLQENTGLGTDHGRASVMMLMGQGIIGGKVLARWPGLEDHQLEGPGDLRVTMDYRDVLAEVLTRRVNADYSHNGRLAAVFPNYQPRFPGVTKA